MGETKGNKQKIARYVFFAGIGIVGVAALVLLGSSWKEDKRIKKQQQELQTKK